MIGVSQSASPGFGFLRQLLLSLRPGGKLWEAPGTKEGPGELLGSSLAAFHVPLRSPAAHALTTERHGLLPLCLDSIFILFPVFLLLQQASRAQILDKATEYIQYMRRKNHTHQQDIDDLKRQNALLEQQVLALEQAGCPTADQLPLLRQQPYTLAKGSTISAFHGGSDSSSESEPKEPQSRRSSEWRPAKLRGQASNKKLSLCCLSLLPFIVETSIAI